ncbi:MAG: SDR family NAD(P)-dependent oxidoreductase, partial [Waterburya sp.]
MNTNLTNQNVVIIGGTSGIGLAVAKLIAERGANLTIASRSQERLLKVAKEIDGNVQIGTIDTLSENSVQEFFANRNDIDHIINFAGDSMSGGVLDTDLTT